MLASYYYLKGSCIRSRAGEKGRILSITDEGVKVGWDEDGRPAPREESLQPTDERFVSSVEILTLDRGWLPLSSVVRVPSADQTLSENTRELIAHLRSLLEDKDRNPFQNKTKLGPGPRGETLTRKRRWKCTTIAPYRQRCVGVAPDNEGRVIHNKIDREWKAAYNKQYKKWRARRKEVAR